MAANRGFIYLLWFMLVSVAVECHIPSSYYSYNLAEPDAPVFINPLNATLSRETALDRLTALRAVMLSAGVSAYIVPTGDAHNSQYIAPADARREWLSGLRGSSGTALVTTNRALVWTDVRYWTQFEVEVDASLWELMRQGVDVTLETWLVQNMPSGSVVAVDPTTYTRSAWNSLEGRLSAVGVSLIAIYDNLVDAARVILDDGPPPRPSNDLVPLSVAYTGKQSSIKLSELAQQISSNSASALLLTALDDIAYTLNLRGSDIPYNPVFFSYLLIKIDSAGALSEVILFWNEGTLAGNVVAHLATENVVVEARPYEEIFNYLRTYSAELGSEGAIWVSSQASHAVVLAIEDGSARVLTTTTSPVAFAKCVKNDVELQGFRLAHIKDGTALVRALHWLHTQLEDGVSVTEVQLADRLELFRSDEENFMGPSFSTIAGAGENGAIIHYSPLREGPQREIRADDMLLLDSGGQYFEGTTDITRTRHMSASPTPAQRLTFTRVLKGQINLATTIVPRGTLGNVIEVLARKFLWDVGLNYGHGTGHGVGHFLNVHEGPIWILSGPTADDPGIAPNMIYSNEPGYYEVGEYGIRHEDLVQTIEMNSQADHILADGLVGTFEDRGAVGFYTISLAPHQTACLDVDLMTDFEIKYLNDYHARVLSTIGPILQQRGLTDDYEWLEKECAPIHRGTSAAILIKSTPILAAISFVVMWIGM